MPEPGEDASKLKRSNTFDNRDRLTFYLLKERSYRTQVETDVLDVYHVFATTKRSQTFQRFQYVGYVVILHQFVLHPLAIPQSAGTKAATTR